MDSAVCPSIPHVLTMLSAVNGLTRHLSGGGTVRQFHAHERGGAVFAVVAPPTKPTILPSRAWASGRVAGGGDEAALVAHRHRLAGAGGEPCAALAGWAVSTVASPVPLEVAARYRPCPSSARSDGLMSGIGADQPRADGTGMSTMPMDSSVGHRW